MTSDTMRAMGPSVPKPNAYTSSTWWYDLRGFFILTFAYRDTLSSQINFFADKIGDSHLEVGVGTGTLFRMILRRHRKIAAKPATRVVGIDYSPEMLSGAKRKFASDPMVEMRQADVHALPFAAASFDSVSLANSLHCFADPTVALREIRRVLRPGGRFTANAILNPVGWAPVRALANAINRWGMKKGILHAPMDAERLLQDVTASGLRICQSFRTGNDFFVEAEA
jgi:ubiquinone/menaquinone biosynthesis C-methylase UbiE